MDAGAHWDEIYKTKAPDKVSWYRLHLETSLALIKRAAGFSPTIIDVGGGESTLVDDLLSKGYQNITVLDISQTALETTKKRLGMLAEKVHWVLADVTEADLPLHYYDVWHDRAVFHFLTSERHRRAYVQKVVHAVKPGGHVILSTFGPEGPTRCSGLEVVRYDSESLHEQFGSHFRLVGSS